MSKNNGRMNGRAKEENHSLGMERAKTCGARVSCLCEAPRSIQLEKLSKTFGFFVSELQNRNSRRINDRSHSTMAEMDEGYYLSRMSAAMV